MYAIYTTPGFIIDSRPYGEAGKLVSTFTRDFGLVTATATGIRYEKSKLRYFTQDYSLGTFSLVRGREFWRLTSAAASDGGNEAGGMSSSLPSDAQALIARIALLLRRLLQGEEPNVALFVCVQTAVDFVRNIEPGILDTGRLQTLESLTVIRIMQRLGYIGDNAGLDGHVASTSWDVVILDELHDKRFLMNRHINAALKESHL